MPKGKASSDTFTGVGSRDDDDGGRRTRGAASRTAPEATRRSKRTHTTRVGATSGFLSKFREARRVRGTGGGRGRGHGGNPRAVGGAIDAAVEVVHNRYREARRVLVARGKKRKEEVGDWNNLAATLRICYRGAVPRAYTGVAPTSGSWNGSAVARFARNGSLGSDGSRARASARGAGFWDRPSFAGIGHGVRGGRAGRAYAAAGPVERARGREIRETEPANRRIARAARRARRGPRGPAVAPERVPGGAPGRAAAVHTRRFGPRRRDRRLGADGRGHPPSDGARRPPAPAAARASTCPRRRRRGVEGRHLLLERARPPRVAVPTRRRPPSASSTFLASPRAARWIIIESVHRPRAARRKATFDWAALRDGRVRRTGKKIRARESRLRARARLDTSRPRRTQKVVEVEDENKYGLRGPAPASRASRRVGGPPRRTFATVIPEHSVMLMQFVVLPRRVQSGRDSREMDVNLPVCIIDGAATLEDWRRLGLLRRDRGVSPPRAARSASPRPRRRFQFNYTVALCRRLSVREIMLYATDEGAASWMARPPRLRDSARTRSTRTRRRRSASSTSARARRRCSRTFCRPNARRDRRLENRRASRRARRPRRLRLVAPPDAVPRPRRPFSRPRRSDARRAQVGRALRLRDGEGDQGLQRLRGPPPHGPYPRARPSRDRPPAGLPRLRRHLRGGRRRRLPRRGRGLCASPASARRRRATTRP